MKWDDGLDDVQWTKLTHAYGKADDVPGLLRGLTSDDEDTRRDSIYELYGNIWHQGTIYEATSHAIPFLIRLHSIDDLPAHDGVATLLMLIGAGRGYYEVHSKLGMLPSNERSLEKVLLEERTNKQAVRDAISPVIDRLAEYRTNVDSNLRETSLRFIYANRDYFENAHSVIREALLVESDEAIREELKEILDAWN